MVEHYIKIARNHLRKVISTNQRDWDERLLVYKLYIHSTTGIMLPSTVFEKKTMNALQPAVLGSPDKKQHMAMWQILRNGCTTAIIMSHQHLKVASDRMKACYDHLANTTGFQERDQVWLYCPTWIIKKQMKLQTSWESPYQVVTWINDLVYRIQCHFGVKMIMVLLDRLVPYTGATYEE
jgi:hypothetical protein